MTCFAEAEIMMRSPRTVWRLCYVICAISLIDLILISGERESNTPAAPVLNVYFRF